MIKGVKGERNLVLIMRIHSIPLYRLVFPSFSTTGLVALFSDYDAVTGPQCDHVDILVENLQGIVGLKFVVVPEVHIPT